MIPAVGSAQPLMVAQSSRTPRRRKASRAASTIVARLLVESLGVKEELRQAAHGPCATGVDVTEKDIPQTLAWPVGRHADHGRLALDTAAAARPMVQRYAALVVVAVVARRMLEPQEELIGYEDRLTQPNAPDVVRGRLAELLHRFDGCDIEAVRRHRRKGRGLENQPLDIHASDIHGAGFQHQTLAEVATVARQFVANARPHARRLVPQTNREHAGGLVGLDSLHAELGRAERTTVAQFEKKLLAADVEPSACQTVRDGPRGQARLEGERASQTAVADLHAVALAKDSHGIAGSGPRRRCAKEAQRQEARPKPTRRTGSLVRRRSWDRRDRQPEMQLHGQTRGDPHRFPPSDPS